jgi:hypothetical protein
MTEPVERVVTEEERARSGEAQRLREVREAYLDEGGEAYPEEEETPRAALLELSRRLRALAKEGFGDLASEARTVWALSLGPLRALHHQAAALRVVEELRLRLSHRSSGQRTVQVLADLRLTADARGDAEALAAIAKVDELLRGRLQNLREERELPASQAAEAAVEALVALMDALRERAPEHLR